MRKKVVMTQSLWAVAPHGTWLMIFIQIVLFFHWAFRSLFHCLKTDYLTVYLIYKLIYSNITSFINIKTNNKFLLHVTELNSILYHKYFTKKIHFDLHKCKFSQREI